MLPRVNSRFFGSVCIQWVLSQRHALLPFDWPARWLVEARLPGALGGTGRQRSEASWASPAKWTFDPFFLFLEFPKVKAYNIFCFKITGGDGVSHSASPSSVLSSCLRPLSAVHAATEAATETLSGCLR